MYKGESIFIDYKSGLDPVIFMQYSTPSGDKLIHQSSVSVNPPQLVVWGLHKFSPWHEKFNQVRISISSKTTMMLNNTLNICAQVISWMFEAGLIDEWKLRTWMRMKAESQEEKIELSNVKQSALLMDDVQGIFILFTLFISASFITFLLEVLFWQGSHCSKKVERENMY